MAGIFTTSSSFTVTPHKISVCVLLQIYASPSTIFHRLISAQDSSTSTRNLLGLFLFSLTKSCETAEEPNLHIIKSQLKIIFGSQNHTSYDHLCSVLSSFESPDDLFVFFNDLRQLLDRIGSISLLDDPLFLDSSSDLGLFLRRCILSFDHLRFESVSILLTNIKSYTKSSSPNPPNLFRNPGDEAPAESCPDETLDVFLRSSSQLQGYLTKKADTIEKYGSNFSSNTFDREMRSLEILSPDLQRIHYLRFLNSFYRSDYPTALENLHRYFDYTAGMEDFDFKSLDSSASLPHGSGKYEFGLFCLGILHFHLQHRVSAIDIFTEAVRVSQQQSNDSSLAYTMSVICNLFTEPGFSCRSGIDEHGGHSSSLSIPQQLFLLLKRSLKRAETLNLSRLISSSHLGIAKFHMRYVQRPLFISGIIPPMNLKTSPLNVTMALNSSLNISSSNSQIPLSIGHFSSNWLKNSTKSPIFSKSSIFGYGFLELSDRLPPHTLQDLGSSYLLRSTAWEIYGSSSFTRLNSYIHAACFAFSSTEDDSSVSKTKLLQQMALFKGQSAAIKALNKTFPKTPNPRIQLLKLQLLHDRALYRGDLHTALHLCQEIESMASPLPDLDMDLKFQSRYRKSLTLISSLDLKKAEEIAISLFSTCHKLNMHMENSAVLLLLAEIHKKSGNPALGMAYAMAALSYCESLNLDLLKACVGVTMAELLIVLGDKKNKLAMRILHGSFAEVVGKGGLEVCGRAYIVEAKCYILDCCYDLALDDLKKGAEMMEVLEFHEMAAEAFYLMATVYDRMAMVEERDLAAASFRFHILALKH